VLLQVLHQGSSGAVHDALGLAGRAARVHDEQGVIERKLQKGGKTDVVTARPINKFFYRFRLNEIMSFP
jgi:hypothetical protein